MYAFLLNPGGYFKNQGCEVNRYGKISSVPEMKITSHAPCSNKFKIKKTHTQC